MKIIKPENRTTYSENILVTLEILEDVTIRVPEATMRTITVNCRTLKFEGFGFEEEQVQLETPV